MNKGRESKQKFIPEWRTVALLLLFVIVIQAICGGAIYFLLETWSDRGSFGDMFGAINSLFSGLALAGVVYAILLQRQELALQREELQMTREELRRTADAQQASIRLRQEELDIIKQRSTAEEEARAKEVAPEFILQDVEESHEHISVNVFNQGGSMTRARVTSAPSGATVRVEPSGGILRDGKGVFIITLIDDTHRALGFTISYQDERHEKRSLIVNCDPWRRQLSSEVVQEDKCYLTSACCDNAGLADDCRELTLMRAFRDEFLMTSVTGVYLVSRYYRTAPTLLSAIRSSPTCDDTMVWIHQQIRATADYYNAGCQLEALDTYLGLIMALESEFLKEANADKYSSKGLMQGNHSANERIIQR